ncbi:MAG: hypothetical protein JWO40_128 [Candidatus Doudnabacteria bacterium]|nr:hypothetical protein [Candidatus Doudnabacteria bacterium]
MRKYLGTLFLVSLIVMIGVSALVLRSSPKPGSRLALQHQWADSSRLSGREIRVLAMIPDTARCANFYNSLNRLGWVLLQTESDDSSFYSHMTKEDYARAARTIVERDSAYRQLCTSNRTFVATQKYKLAVARAREVLDLEKAYYAALTNSSSLR